MSAQAAAGCDCIELTNKALAEHNTELGLNFQINRQTGGITTYIAIHTTIVEKKRGARPVSILPTFCPFCGTRYLPEESTS